ncbi:hypothetical protein [Bradyrhizobium sp.]|uniref:hypothetical protein n=1 Tax=Bradyrhizobium sp. TaxID=376 RepID=UPI000AE5110F|nr:hypothetical protein [Bradyrhizobium sp.]
MNDVSQKANGFVHDLGQAARKNPLSAALIGMGVLWLFANGRAAERAGEFARSGGFDRIPEAAGDAFEAARSTVRSGVDSVSGQFASARDSLREGSVDVLDGATRLGREYAGAASTYVSALPGTGTEMFDAVRSNMADIFKAQPLALGVVGMAIGAGIAAALPPTDTEASYLGKSSDLVKAKATEFASEQTERVAKVAGEVVDAVSEEARRQGLTMEDAKAAVGNVSARVSRVVEGAGKGVSEKLAPQSPSANPPNLDKVTR